MREEKNADITALKNVIGLVMCNHLQRAEQEISEPVEAPDMSCFEQLKRPGDLSHVGLEDGQRQATGRLMGQRLLADNTCARPWASAAGTKLLKPFGRRQLKPLA